LTTTRAGRRPAHQWLVGGWTGGFWALIALAVVWLLASPDLTTGRRVTGAVAIAVLSLAFLVLLHRGEQDQEQDTGWRPVAYLVVAVVVVGVLCGVDGALSLLMFVVHPQIWMFTPGPARAIGLVIAMTVTGTVGYLVRFGFTLQTLQEVGPLMAVGLLFSVLMGMWVSRIIEESAERAELIAALQSARAELGEAEHARGVMAERERLAGEIHDTLAQGFTSIVMLAQAAAAGIARHPERAAERLATIEQVARENLAEARALVAAFAPVDLEGTTLIEAVRRLTTRFAEQTGLMVSVEVDDHTAWLDRAREVVLVRAVQESLTNVHRHAAARRVLVRLSAEDGGARLEVGDDGIGFAAGDDAKGFGLAGMRGRVAQVGGQMEVDSTPGVGTQVVIRVPAAGGEAP
jgi:signal transduction histidine kinase